MFYNRYMNKYMQLAIEEAERGINQGEGGPFGCVIVKDGEVIASGHNLVLKKHDPTAHGEISAIRLACEKLGTHSLKGCDLYTTGEPCTMCLCACLWANVSHIYYGCRIEDNAKIGFRDEKFDDLFSGREKIADLLTELDREACLELFDRYTKLPHQIY